MKTGPHQYVDLKQYEFYNPTTVIALPHQRLEKVIVMVDGMENNHLGSSISS